ncbi:MAG: site-specific DNA-methyltransferase [Oscillospiraceae bacterium]|jgi:adenine-specific DNA-methyltransferase|nr:site-specific DNA-methyltransferase [Oscillospiraceae bacterium]
MIGNISKQKRDDLIAKISQIRTFISVAPQDENTGNLLTYLSELEKEVKSKKYGLVFEEHRETVDELLETSIPVLIEEDLFIDNGGQVNFLIEGDNLAALHLLEKTHKGSVDIIYIDPPYNTGKKDDESGGFIYDDKFVDSNDTFIHSKWLSFIKNRITLAKKLLCKDGVIFISIGKEEFANLKLLCDAVFGESQLLGQLVRRTKTTSFRGNYFALRQDYVLCYANNQLPSKFMDVADIKDYKKIETEGTRKGEHYKDDTAFYLSTLEYRPNQRYWITCPDGQEVLPPGNTIPPQAPVEGDGMWRWSKEQFEQKKDLIVFKPSKRSPLITKTGETARWNLYTKSYYLDKKADGNIPQELLLDFINRNGSEELKNLGINFPFPKPSELLKYLFQITNKNKNATILDFFAGSGTTGHAVMKLNATDEGNRRYILCTNNENNICRDITYKRVKSVIERDNYKATLKYYRIDYVPISDRVYYEYADELLKHVKELVELENGINFTENAEIAIVRTDEELDTFIDNVKEYGSCRRLYRGHDILPSAEQEAKLRERDIAVCVIPDYYYRELEGRR